MRKFVLFFNLFLIFSCVYSNVYSQGNEKRSVHDTLGLQVGNKNYFFKVTYGDLIVSLNSSGGSVKAVYSPVLKGDTLELMRERKRPEGSQIIKINSFLKYYGSEKSTLFYQRVALKDTLKNLYIGFEVDVKKIDAARKGRKHTLVFQDCYFHSVVAIGEQRPYTIISALSFENCTVKYLRFSNLILEKAFGFLVNCTSAKFDSCEFKANLEVDLINNKDSTRHYFPKILFGHCKYRNVTKLSAFSNVQFFLTSFIADSLLFLKDHPTDTAPILQPKFQISNGQISDLFILIGREAAFLFENGTSFKGQLNVIELTPSSLLNFDNGLKGLYVFENSHITISQYSQIETFHLPLSTLKNTSITYVQKDGLDLVYQEEGLEGRLHFIEHGKNYCGWMNDKYCKRIMDSLSGSALYYENLNNKLQAIRDEVNDRNISDIRRKNEVIEWIDYQHNFFRREYLSNKKDKSLSERGELLWLSIIQATVKSGYEGGWRFALWMFGIVFGFTIYFMFFNRRLISEYVTYDTIGDSQQLQLNFRKRRSFFNWILDLFRCLWFSFIIFISLKFPAKLFRLPNRVLFVLIIEWLIGLFLMIIFIVYIVAKYPFIKTLFGI
jgi:hypothetical protein